MIVSPFWQSSTILVPGFAAATTAAIAPAWQGNGMGMGMAMHADHVLSRQTDTIEFSTKTQLCKFGCCSWNTDSTSVKASSRPDSSSMPLMRQHKPDSATARLTVGNVCGDFVFCDDVRLRSYQNQSGSDMQSYDSRIDSGFWQELSMRCKTHLNVQGSYAMPSIPTAPCRCASRSTFASHWKGP